MPNYIFVAKDPHGRNYRGKLFGQNEQAVYFRLQKQGYVVLSVTEQDRSPIMLFHPKITPADIEVFAKLMSTVIDAGLAVADALAAIEEQTENLSFKRVIRRIREDVEQGSALSAAFHKHPRVFPHYFVSMVKSGEASGSLPTVFIHLSDYIEKDQNLRRKVIGAFMYPGMVLSICGAMVIFFIYQVVPSFMKLFTSGDKKIPVPPITQFLYNLSMFLHKDWKFVCLGTILFMIALKAFFKSPLGKAFHDRMMLYLPLMGIINTRISISRCTRTLGSMLKCGVPLITSLEIVKYVVDNKHIEKDIDKIIDSVESGGTISSSLRMAASFPPLVTYMISAGEQSGRLPELLYSCAEALDNEIEHLIKRLLIIIEPVVIFFVAIIVGLIAYSVYMPMYSSILSMH